MKGVSSRNTQADSLVYVLRHATSADTEFIYQLKKETLRDYVEYYWGWDEHYQRTRFAKTFDPTNHQIILVEDITIGSLLVMFTKSEIILGGIFILPVFQNQGIGTRIINELLDLARQEHLPVKLQVFKMNPAVRLYQRLGFEVIDQTDTHFVMRTANL